MVTFNPATNSLTRHHSSGHRSAGPAGRTWRHAQPPIIRQRQGPCFLCRVSSSAASDAAMHTRLSSLQEQAAHSTLITECTAWHAGITLQAPLQQRCASPHLRPLHSGGGYHAKWVEIIMPCMERGEAVALDTHALAWAAAATLQAVCCAVMQQALNRMGEPPSELTKLRSCCHPRGIDSRSRPCSWGRCWSSSRASQSWGGRSGRRGRWGSRCNPGRSQELHGRAELRGSNWEVGEEMSKEDTFKLCGCERGRVLEGVRRSLGGAKRRE